MKPVKFYWMHRPYHRMMTRREMSLPETLSITRQLIRRLHIKRSGWCANDIYAANMMDIDIDAMGIPDPEGHPMRPVEQRERKRKGLRISDRRRRKAKSRSLSKKGGPRWWDLNPRGYEQGIGPGHRRKKGGTSHQAALVIGGIQVINTGIGYGQWAPKHSKGMGSQRGE